MKPDPDPPPRRLATPIFNRMSKSVDGTIQFKRELLPELDREYWQLLSAFELFKATLSEPLQAEMIKRGRGHGFSVVANSLFSRCIIVAHRMLDAGKETSPSLLNLARPIIKKDQEQHAKVLARLEDHHLELSEVVVHWRAGARRFFMPNVSKVVNDSTRKVQRSDFQKRVEIIRSEWTYLDAVRKEKLEGPRHKVFAHLELIRVPIESPEEREHGGKPTHAPRFAYQTIQGPTPEEVSQALQEIVPRIGKFIEQLNYVWAKLILVYHPSQQSLKKAAQAFWKFPPDPQ